jgi:Zn-dependent protease/CBS domain-containing protein
MTSTLRLGRIAGIDVGAHWSWLLVVGLIVWSLAAGVFPTTNPGLSNGTYLVMAVAAALLFFASIVLHELGHALQARRDGIAIGGITLWVFGGVAHLRSQPPSAAAELRMAAAGPAISLALGAICLLVAIALPLPAAVDAVAFWVGQMNLYLAAFNLLPAFPLDGGRVLRAALWARRHDFMSATRTAARWGTRLGQLLILLGLLLVIFVGDLGGLWLSFLGWFLVAAAEAEFQAALVRDALAGITVRDVMTRDPVIVDADASVKQFMEDVFLPTRHTAFPVVENGAPVGIVGFRQALALPRDAWPTAPVRTLIPDSADVCVTPDTPLSDVLMRLSGGEPRRLLVCRDGRVEGLLSLTDVARVLQERMGTAWPATAAPRSPRRAPIDRRSRPRSPVARP